MRDRRPRPLMDRLLRPVRPTAVVGYCPLPRQFANGVWLFERRLRMPFGLLLPCTMTVIRLADARLAVHSPVALDDETYRQIVALGEVTAVIAPNSFHYLFASEYPRRFPTATMFLAPDLSRRVPDGVAGSVLDESTRPPWSSELDYLVFDPTPPFTEVVFLHRPTSTLILTDLALNMRRIDPWTHRIVWRASGIPPRLGPNRAVRLTLLGDRAAARPALRRILAWDFDRLIVAHGDPVAHGGTEAFTRAFQHFLR